MRDPSSTVDPLALILARGLREIAERKALEDAQRRAKMRLVDGKRGGAAA
jgi:hypothetical protein